MRSTFFALCLAVLALPAQGRADEAPPGTVQVASRLFLVGTDPSALASDGDDLSLSFEPWFRSLAQDDPVLEDFIGFQIFQPLSPPAFLLGPDGLPRHFTDRVRVPEAFRIDGYTVITNEGGEWPHDFLFRLDIAEPDFLVNCARDVTRPPTDRFHFCNILATYPHDPTILLEATLFSPPPFAELHGLFAPTMERLREIALCLDVTEAPLTDPDAALADLLKANPLLEGCDNRFSS